MEIANLNSQVVLISKLGDKTISLEEVPSGVYIATNKKDNTVMQEKS